MEPVYFNATATFPHFMYRRRCESMHHAFSHIPLSCQDAAWKWWRKREEEEILNAKGDANGSGDGTSGQGTWNRRAAMLDTQMHVRDGALGPLWADAHFFLYVTHFNLGAVCVGCIFAAPPSPHHLAGLLLFCGDCACVRSTIVCRCCASVSLRFFVLDSLHLAQYMCVCMVVSVCVRVQL